MGAAVTWAGWGEAKRLGGEYEVHADVPSLSSPGLTSAVSDRLDSLCEFHRFFEEYIELCKNPPPHPSFRRTELKDVTESGFTRRNLISANVDEEVWSTSVFTINKKRHEIRMDVYGPKGAHLETGMTILHKRPYKMESWSTEIHRRHDESLAAIAYGRITQALASLDMEPVQIRASVASPSGSGLRSIVSDPLSSSKTSPERLFEALAKNFRNPLLLGPLKSATPESPESETDFTLRLVLDGAMIGAPGTDLVVINKYELDKDKGEIVSKAHDEQGALKEVTMYKIHARPMQVEVWGEVYGSRKSGPLLAALMETFINEVARHITPTRSLDIQSLSDDEEPKSSRVARAKAAFDGLWEIGGGFLMRFATKQWALWFNPKVRFHPNVMSPTGSGLQSVLSETLDHLLDFDLFWDELIDVAKHPPRVPGITKHELVETTDNTFTMAIVGGGPLLDLIVRETHFPLLQAGDGVKTEFHAKRKYTLDREAGKLKTQNYGPCGEIIDEAFVVIHKEPLCMECWWELPSCRRAGPGVKAIAQARLDAALQKLGLPQVVMQENANSPIGFGLKSAMSEVLPPPANPDDLFAALLDGFKNPPVGGVVISATFEQDASPDMFTVSMTLDGSKLKSAAKEVHRKSRYRVDHEKRLVVSTSYDATGVVTETLHFRVIPDPLQLEVWAMGSPVRVHGPALAAFMQFLVHEILERLRS